MLSPKGLSAVLFLLLLTLFSLTGCNNQQQPGKGNELSAYFPAAEGMVYQYKGTGNEFASFTREIKHADEPYIQFHDDNGGTVTAVVYRRGADQLARISSRSEYYSSESLIKGLKNEQPAPTEIEEIIIKTPLEEGNSWQSGKHSRQITGVDLAVTVPAGVFHGVLKIKTLTETEQGEFTGYEYYARNIGLIKRESLGEGYRITSELESYGLPPVKAAADGSDDEGVPRGSSGSTAGSGQEAGPGAVPESSANPGLLAYQLERQLRAEFQSACDTIKNLYRLSENAETGFARIRERLQHSLTEIASPRVINQQLAGLDEIFQGGEGEITFPTHEVVKGVEVGAEKAGRVDVRLQAVRYYPAREWSGAAYNRSINYTVSLVKRGGSWIIGGVEEATSPGPAG